MRCSPTVTTTSQTGFDDLLRYVEEELSFATSHYNDSYLDRRVHARMRRTGADTYTAYLGTLKEDPAEADRLLKALSINVTSFFRNPPMWEELRDVLRTLSRESGRLDVWSAACSDGREPYSLAMLAMDDSQVDETRLSITATDISKPSLATARTGVYESTRTTDIEEELAPLSNHDDYLRQDGKQFAIQPAVKQLVDFRRHDLIRNEPIGTFDLILCRNLFIYIDPAYKDRILSTLDDSIVTGGYLVIGMAETLPTDYRASFEAVGRRSRIHRRTG